MHPHHFSPDDDLLATKSPLDCNLSGVISRDVDVINVDELDVLEREWWRGDVRTWMWMWRRKE